VDSITGEPVLARIRQGESTLFVTDETGAFDVLPSLVDIESPLQFVAPGFKEHHVRLPARTPEHENGALLVKLTPLSRASVLFLQECPDGSCGVESVRVMIRPCRVGRQADSQFTVDGGSYIGDSGADGSITIPLARRSIVRYEAPSGESGDLVILPGSASRVDLGSPLRKFKFLDGLTGTPLESLRVQLSRGHLGAERSSLGVTSASGEVSLAAIQGAQRLTLDRSDMVLVGIVELDRSRPFEEPLPAHWLVHMSSARDDTRVLCSQDQFVLHVHESGSGRPVSAPLLWGLERAKSDGLSWLGLADGMPGAALDGLARLSVARLQKAMEFCGKGYRLTFWFEGYQPWSTSDFDGWEGSFHVAVDPSPGRTLRLTTPGGDAYRGELHVLDMDHSYYLDWNARANREGFLGPYEWSGGSWLLMDLGGATVASLTGQELAAGDVVQVTVFHDCGQIRFTDVPASAGAPVASHLRAVSSRSHGSPMVARPTTRPGEWIIDDVAPGEYVVGPKELVQWYWPVGPQSSTSGFPSVAVGSGKVVEVQWQDSWILETAIGGIVEVLNGDARRLRLYKLFGDGRIRSRLGGLGAMVPLSESGEYRMTAGEAAPRALLVAFGFPQGYEGNAGVAPIAVVGVGESLSIDGTPLRLCTTARDSIPEGIVIELPFPSWHRAAIDKYIVESSARFYWAGTDTLEIPFYGSGVATLTLCGRRGISEPIDLDEARRTPQGFLLTEQDFGEVPIPTDDGVVGDDR